jgi:DNA helicase HerA-like ATPase
MSTSDASGDGIIGTVVRPGEGPNEFVFVTPDSRSVKTGEFVTYDVSVDGTEEAVIARVSNREQARGLPETFMSDPSVAPESIAATLGVPTDDIDLYRITATVIGFYDTEMSTFSNPRQLPQPGTPLRPAPADQLETVLPNLGTESDRVDVEELEGLANIGWLLNRPAETVNVRIPIDEFASTHLAILASTGSGKSYAASVLIEEMMQPDSRAALLVFDPHGEYDTLAEMQSGEQFRGEDGYEPDVDYFDPDRLRVRISELELGDVMAVLDDPSDRMQERLAGGWRSMQQRESRTWGVDALVDEMYEIYGDDDVSVGALEWRLRRSIQRNELFQPDVNVPLEDLVQPGRCTVLQMDTLDRRNQQMIATVLLRRIYRSRLAAERGRDAVVDFPLFALFEEGHRFAPSSGEAPSLGIMRTITSEGRKFGFGLGIVSQRPSKIDPDTLSQCGTQLSMQIQNPNDQEAIKNSVEAVGEDVLQELPGLTPGQAVVSGDAMNTPVLIRVRERHTTHGAESLTATEDWREAYAARERDATASEAADLGGGDSTGVQDLD